MELANTGTPGAVLEEAQTGATAVRARTRTSHDCVHRRHRAARRTDRHAPGWLHNRRSSGKIHFLTVRDGTGFIQCVMSKQAVGDEAFKQADHLSQESAVDRRTAPSAPTPRARAATSSTSRSLEVVSGVARLSDHAEGARRRLPDGSPPPLDPLAAAAGDPAHPPRGHQRGPRLLQRARLHPRRHADLHAGRVRGHDDAVSGPVLRGRDGLPDAERAALQRGERDGARPRVLLRPDVPRREVEDAPPPHRVLDGRAGGRVRDARRRHGSGRGSRRLGRRPRARAAQAGAEGARARHDEARDRSSRRSRASRTTKRRRSSRRKGCRSSGAATSARPTRPRLSEQFDRPVWSTAIRRRSRRST